MPFYLTNSFISYNTISTSKLISLYDDNLLHNIKKCQFDSFCQILLIDVKSLFHNFDNIRIFVFYNIFAFFELSIILFRKLTNLEKGCMQPFLFRMIQKVQKIIFEAKRKLFFQFVKKMFKHFLTHFDFDHRFVIRDLLEWDYAKKRLRTFPSKCEDFSLTKNNRRNCFRIYLENILQFFNDFRLLWTVLQNKEYQISIKLFSKWT